MFVQNMELKMQDTEFLSDMDVLTREGGGGFDPLVAWDIVKQAFVERMPGRRE